MSALAAVPDTRPAHGPRLRVDLAAVAANTRLFAARTDAAVMAVVKADGFGHGAADVARTALAHGATSLGVTSIDEALDLRAAGLEAPMLSWLNPLDASYDVALAAGVDLAVPSREHLAAVAAGRHGPDARPGSTCTSTPAWPATAPSRRRGPVCAAPHAGRSAPDWCGSSV